jgi:hypothetical protein
MDEIAQFVSNGLTPYYDPRDIFVEAPPNEDSFELDRWRTCLRALLYEKHKGCSALSCQKLTDRSGFEMHEGIFPRSCLSGVSWAWMLHAEPNCLLLTPSEHRPQPPSRVLCYWLSVALQRDKSLVDSWIASLPFKTRPDTPWHGTQGLDIIGKEVSESIRAKPDWIKNFAENEAVMKAIDQYA